MKSKLVQIWNDFWFAPSPAARLGAARFVVFSIILIQTFNISFRIWYTMAPEFWLPIWYLDWSRPPFLPWEVARVVEGVWRLALVLAAVGFLGRLPLFFAAVVGTYLFGIRQCFGYLTHDLNPLLLLLWIFAISPSTDGFSVDAWLRKKFRNRPMMPDSGDYKWPLQLGICLWALIFWSAGVAKIRNSGLDWVMSDSLQNNLIKNAYSFNGYWVPHGLGAIPLKMAQFPNFCHWAAALAIGIELSAPLVFVGRRTKFAIFCMVAGLQIAISYIILVRFSFYLSLYCLFIPWDIVYAQGLAMIQRVRNRLDLGNRPQIP